MGERRYNRYDKQFKIEAVRRSFEPGKTAAEVARELDIKVTQLYKWREEFERKESQAFPKSGKSTQESELEKLRRENKRLEQERDILKKSLIFFVKDQEDDLNSLENTSENSR